MGAARRYDGTPLIRLRKALGWTQERLGQECGISGAYICRVEGGTEALSPNLRRKIREAIRKAREEQDRLAEELVNRTLT